MPLKHSQKIMIGAAIALGALLLTRKKSSAVPSGLSADMRRAFSLIDTAGYSGGNWAAISKMETANFTSKVFRAALNPWGMKVAKIRPNHQDGAYVGDGSTNWARYNSIDRAMLDIIDWCNYTKFPKGELSLEKHVAEMGARGYYGTESYQSYLSKVRAWLKK